MEKKRTKQNKKKSFSFSPFLIFNTWPTHHHVNCTTLVQFAWTTGNGQAFIFSVEFLITFWFSFWMDQQQPAAAAALYTLSSLWMPERIKPLFQGARSRTSLAHSSSVNGILWLLHTWGPGGDVSKQPREERVWWTICHLARPLWKSCPPRRLFVGIFPFLAMLGPS